MTTKKIEVFFDCSAAEEVTGSNYYVKADKNILLDAGYYQCGDALKEYNTNKQKEKYKVKDMDYVCLSHCHNDHCGRLPILFSRGFRGKVIVPEGSTPILRDMLLDGAHITERDSKQLSLQRGKNYDPLYTEEDVFGILDLVEELPFNEITELDNSTSIRFTSAGHIPCAAQIELFVSKKGRKAKILYTGDLGSNIESYYVGQMDKVEKADLVIGETTYGSSKKQGATKATREDDKRKIKEVIKETCLVNKSKVLIPVFALSRLPEILTMLYELFGADPQFKVPVVIDSPLGLKHIKNYFKILPTKEKELLQNVLAWKNIIQIGEYKESVAYSKLHVPAIVLSSSGMMNAGRVLVHLPFILSDMYARILFVGYASEGSLAHKIKTCKEKKVFKIGKLSAFNRAGITSLNSFSSHAQRETLLDYYSSIDCQKIVLVHGAAEGKLEFAEDLQKYCSKKNKNPKILAATKSLKVNL